MYTRHTRATNTFNAVERGISRPWSDTASRSAKLAGAIELIYSVVPFPIRRFSRLWSKILPTEPDPRDTLKTHRFERWFRKEEEGDGNKEGRTAKKGEEYWKEEEEKKKKKGKTNSFVVINQINYPSFNEDWCTNATFFLSLSLLLSTFVTSIADSSIHLSAHSSVMYLNHGTSKEESREMGQRNFYSYIYVPVFFFDSTIPFARNGRQDNHLFYFLPRLFKSCTMYIYLCIY